MGIVALLEVVMSSKMVAFYVYEFNFSSKIT